MSGKRLVTIHCMWSRLVVHLLLALALVANLSAPAWAGSTRDAAVQMEDKAGPPCHGTGDAAPADADVSTDAAVSVVPPSGETCAIGGCLCACLHAAALPLAHAVMHDGVPASTPPGRVRGIALASPALGNLLRPPIRAS